MGSLNNDLGTRTGGLQSQPELGADGNPIIRPVGSNANDGHVNPPPPPAPDAEAPVTNAAFTAAMQGFAAQFAEMQAQQQKYQDRIDSLQITDDGRIIPTGRALFQTPTRSTAATNAVTNGEKEVDPEVAKLRHDLDTITSKVHGATGSAPEISKVLAETKKSPFTRRIAAIPLKDQTALRLQFYNKGDDPKGWLRTFEIAMKRQKYASPEEQDANYCQLFIEHMNRDATGWFSNLPAESIDNFDDLSTAFLKHFSMFMSKSSTNLFTMTQGKDEPLREFIERFSTAAAEHSDLPDGMGIKALENGIWFESKFKENLMLDEPATLQDALHRSQKYVLVEECKAHHSKIHETTKESSRQENKRKSSFSVAGKTPRRDEDDNDHTKWCSFHGRTGHATETCRHFADQRRRENTLRRDQNTKDAPKQKDDDAEKNAPPPLRHPDDLPPPPKRQVH